MDPEPRPDLLIVRAGPTRPIALASWLAAGLVAVGACSDPGPQAPPDLPAVGGQVSLIRVPRHGGLVEAYAADSLAEPAWRSRVGVGPMADVLGVNLEARLLLGLDSARRVIAVDLESGGLRQLASGVRTGVFVPDGSLFTISDDGRITRYDLAVPTPYRPRLPGPLRFHTGTLSGRFVGLTAARPSELLILGTERALHQAPVPPGEAAATYWGDLVAVGDGSQVVLFETGEPFRATPVSVGARVQHLAFSPSGHRIYAATNGAGIVVIDRYSLARVATITVPGEPRAIRTDGSGRWLLARATTGDSAWVIDLATGRLLATVGTRWGPDLPTVAGATTLLARTGGDVVGMDLGRANRPEIGRIVGGGADLWLVSTWLPRDRARQAAAVAESALVAQDRHLVTDSVAAAPLVPEDRLYLQVSSSQNPDWSRELARQLDAAGYPSRVLPPASVDDGYRVVVGPYTTREEAEDVGRKLGRPYFVLTNPRIR